MTPRWLLLLDTRLISRSNWLSLNCLLWLQVSSPLCIDQNHYYTFGLHRCADVLNSHVYQSVCIADMVLEEGHWKHRDIPMYQRVSTLVLSVRQFPSFRWVATLYNLPIKIRAWVWCRYCYAGPCSLLSIVISRIGSVQSTLPSGFDRLSCAIWSIQSKTIRLPGFLV